MATDGKCDPNGKNRGQYWQTVIAQGMFGSGPAKNAHGRSNRRIGVQWQEFTNGSRYGRISVSVQKTKRFKDWK